MIKAIIFDLWETLGTKNVAVSKTLQEKFHISKTDDYVRKYEEAVQLKSWGTEREMAENFLSEFGIEKSLENIEFVIDVFKQGIVKATLFGGMSKLLGSLKQGDLKLGLLSNTTIFESVVLENLKIRNLFDEVIISSELGVAKPNPIFFKQVIDILKENPENLLFIDDNPSNVKAAQKLGIESYLFRDIEDIDFFKKQGA